MNNTKPQQLFPLIFGIALATGLALGLLIGWVLWPVEWAGATLRDLDRADQAEYLAAVADAFVIYSDPEAAEIAWRRLQGFQPDVQQAINDAIFYFRDSQQPERAIRISNLGRLATAIGLVPPTLAMTDNPMADQATGAPVATQAAVVDSAPTTAVPSAEASGWMRWLLWVVVLLLIGGGIVLLRPYLGQVNQGWLSERLTGLQGQLTALRQRPQAADDTLGADEFTDEDYTIGAQRSSQRQATMAGRHLVTAEEDLAFDDEDENGWQAANADYDEIDYHTAPPVGRADYRRPPDDPDFAEAVDDDNEDDFGEDDLDQGLRRAGQFVTTDEDALPTGSRSGTPARYQPTAADEADEDDLADDDEGYDPAWDEEWQAKPGPTASGRPASHAAHSQGQATDESGEDEEEGEEDDAEIEAPPLHRNPTAAPAIRHREPTPSTPAPLPPRTRYKILDQHTLQYRIGMPEYDESKAILDPAAGKYIGEFGMGVSTKNGLVQTGPDQVIALEVWLFDKSDERSMGQQTRILLSEYAIDNNLEQVFLKERQDNPRPFTAQPGVHFQLESQNLLLDCVIVDVKYTQSGAAKGIFQQIKVEMTVQQKR